MSGHASTLMAPLMDRTAWVGTGSEQVGGQWAFELEDLTLQAVARWIAGYYTATVIAVRSMWSMAS
jgi:hypothetical protein